MHPVKIIMGLHPNAGWRSFKTDRDVRIRYAYTSPATPQFAYAGGLVADEQLRNTELTSFGFALLEEFTGINYPIRFVRYRQRQFEIFLSEESGGWESYEHYILGAIAMAHSRTHEYELETHDMSGGESSWDRYFLEELEEIEEFENSFAAG